jgi:hypothetical protein
LLLRHLIKLRPSGAGRARGFKRLLGSDSQAPITLGSNEDGSESQPLGFRPLKKPFDQ